MLKHQFILKIKPVNDLGTTRFRAYIKGFSKQTRTYQQVSLEAAMRFLLIRMNKFLPDCTGEIIQALKGHSHPYVRNRFNDVRYARVRFSDDDRLAVTDIPCIISTTGLREGDDIGVMFAKYRGKEFGWDIKNMSSDLLFILNNNHEVTGILRPQESLPPEDHIQLKQYRRYKVQYANAVSAPVYWDIINNPIRTITSEPTIEVKLI